MKELRERGKGRHYDCGPIQKTFGKPRTRAASLFLHLLFSASRVAVWSLDLSWAGRARSMHLSEARGPLLHLVADDGICNPSNSVSTATTQNFLPPPSSIFPYLMMGRMLLLSPFAPLEPSTNHPPDGVGKSVPQKLVYKARIRPGLNTYWYGKAVMRTESSFLFSPHSNE